MTTTHELTLDLQKKGELQRIDVVQGDAGTRLVELTLESNGGPWEIPAEAQPAVRYLKPDGSSGVYDQLPDGGSAFRFDGNVLTMELAPQLLTCAGAVQVQVELSFQQQRIATFAFLIVVEQAVAMDSETGDYVNWTKLHLPQVTNAEQGQFLQVAQVDEDGRVVELAPVDDPSVGANQRMDTLERNLDAVGQRVEDASVEAWDAWVLALQAVKRPQTAQVGQLLAVKAVTAEGYPTEWETVDLPEEKTEGMCAFYITLTGDDENGYTADKTATEIREAMEKGCILYVKATVDGGQLILTQMDDLLDFSLSILHITYIAMLDLSDTDDSVNVYFEAQQISPNDIGALTPEHVLPLIHNVPTKLPNPQKLTFSGAGSGEYDGSAPIDVKLPRGWDVASEIVTTEAQSEITIPLPVAAGTKRFNYRFSVRVPGNSGEPLNTPAVVYVGDTEICHPVLMSDANNEGTLFAEIYAYRGMAFGIWHQIGAGVQIGHDHLDNPVNTEQLTNLRITAPEGKQFPAGMAVMVEFMIVEAE